ncbi:phosphatase PAP2 family protein [Pseudolactococcus insecticola]|uniref:Phosphatidic acid phosphatase type 2/haloperoxidase domain-containing protein n=1 Tax=Pseudolactococcus insecticola TaxID=2709158 RepID=A0A6A0B680_9LACT|nr:phosphatase PAP2 family protein [Lactococcus insecticola]GFH40018.1 hypothetical protein Hs20B_04160 [Lactococcus insecticola]
MSTQAKSPLLRNFLIAAVVLLIVASFGDYQISKTIMNQNSIFGTIFQNYGLFPENLIGFIAGQIIVANGLKRDIPVISKVLLVAGGLAFAFWETLHAVDNFLFYTYSSIGNVKVGAALGAANNDGGAVAYPHSLQIVISVIIWVIGSAIAYQWLKNKTEKSLQYLTTVAIAGVAVVYLSEAIVDTMKNNWGRFRPYEIFGNVKDAHFTAFWHQNGVNGHKSFPSGHTMAGMLAAFLPFFVERKNVALQRKMTIVTIAYGVLMGLSRIRIGAHFLSDVTVSGTIVFALIFLSMQLLGYRFVEESDALAVDALEDNAFQANYDFAKI